MIPVAKLKGNLEFNKNLGELIDVMKLAATLQFNQFRSGQESSAEFLSSLEVALNAVSRQRIEAAFLNPRPNLPAGIILMSSDEGFLGELNELLVNKLMDIREARDRIIVLGRQGADYLEELKLDFVTLPSADEKLKFASAQKLRDEIFSPYLKGAIGKIHIIYARFVNITLQQIESETLLPLTGFSSAPPASHEEFIIEPNINSVIQGWVKLWLGFRLYQIMWSSKLAEFAARIMHLEGSIQELNRINQHLKLEYFKYLHSLSDKAIREISASRLLRRH
jgi:F-type H+-transporting ATPase subunit gamma